MARKPNFSNRSVRLQSGNIFDDKAFIEGVFNDEYILVVGSGVILDRNKFPDTGGDINQYIINEINKDRRSERNGFVDHKDFTEIAMFTPINEIDPIYSLLADDYDFDLNDISPELTNLLRTKLFRFVLTTTIDGYIETLMRDIWGDELRIVSIEESYSLQDFQTELSKCRQNKYNQPTLFYVFGHVRKGHPRPRGFVETDTDAIKVIEKWMKLDNGKEYIVPFLKSKRMLTIGCNFDDWYFRFFWYIITRGFGYNRNDDIRSQDNLAISLNDSKLISYLSRLDVCIHNDTWQFMANIYNLLTSIDESNPFRSMVLNKRRHNGIFISYKSVNVVYASKLFCKLANEKGFNVWFDNVSLDGGSRYHHEIKDAIEKSQIFIPILSKEVEADLKEKGTAIDTFYSDEWRWAAERLEYGLKIIPLAIDGYNLRGDSHAFFEEIIGCNETNQFSGIDMEEKFKESSMKVGYAKLIESINKQLGLTN